MTTLSSPSTSNGNPENEVERQLTILRQALDRMEQCVGEMMSMLYNVDLFMDRPQEKTAGGKDPKTALEHISELFHVSAPSLLEFLIHAHTKTLVRCINRN